MNVSNPVKEFYKDYVFNTKIPTIVCKDYLDVLEKAKSVKTSCILLAKDIVTVSDRVLDVNLSFNKDVETVLVLNVTLKGKSSAHFRGKNYSISNLSLLDGDSKFKPPEFIVNIEAESMKLINFSMINYKCNSDDTDYIRVRNSGKNFQLYNSILDGKSINGVFLRLDFPENHYIKNCVVRNVNKGSTANGGEAIRLATSGFENDKANCVIDQCYFANCKSDPEIVSIKCSQNTVKNCIFENNGKSRLVLRHTHNDIIENCYFDGSGMRVYGTKHNIRNIQLVNNANILLDDKKGKSYVVAKDIIVNGVYYDNVKTPVTNDGINCTVTNVKKELRITKNMLLNNDIVTPKPEPTPDPSPKPISDPEIDEIEIIPKVVDKNKKYKLNKDLTKQQLKELLKSS
jgi:hypothetical protein